jgi:hypothetical protein
MKNLPTCNDQSEEFPRSPTLPGDFKELNTYFGVSCLQIQSQLHIGQYNTGFWLIEQIFIGELKFMIVEWFIWCFIVCRSARSSVTYCHWVWAEQGGSRKSPLLPSVHGLQWGCWLEPKEGNPEISALFLHTSCEESLKGRCGISVPVSFEAFTVVKVHIVIFWVMTCSLLDGCQPWWWRQYVAPECWYPLTRRSQCDRACLEIDRGLPWLCIVHTWWCTFGKCIIIMKCHMHGTVTYMDMSSQLYKTSCTMKTWCVESS